MPNLPPNPENKLDDDAPARKMVFPNPTEEYLRRERIRRAYQSGQRPDPEDLAEEKADEIRYQQALGEAFKKKFKDLSAPESPLPLESKEPPPTDSNAGMAKRKPVDKWLGIGSIVVTILLFLFGKTPVLVGILSVAIFVLLIHPAWNFWWIEKSLRRRLAAVMTLAIAVIAIGYFAWPVSPLDTTGVTPLQPVMPTLIPASAPNLIPVSYGTLHILYDPATKTFKESDSGNLAVVARFRNAHEHGKEITDANDIRAHIYFEPIEFYKNLDKNIPGFANVDNGIWLDEKHPVVSFTRGETKTLILAVDMGDGGFGAFDYRIEKGAGAERLLPRVPKLTVDKYVVKVEIIGGVHGELAELYHFTITLRPEFNISFG